MKVKELIALLEKCDGELDVMTKKTDFCGNIGEIYSVKEDSYSFFGRSVPCILLSDQNDDDDEDELDLY